MREFIVEFRRYILELHGLAVNECPPHDEVAGRRTRKKAVKGLPFFGRQVVEGHQVKKPIVEPRNRAEVRLTQLGRACDHGLEYRLHLCGRAADDFQHLRGRGLPLQRFAQLAGALLLSLKQADVLDRDHRLVGERGHQLDLLVGERQH